MSIFLETAVSEQDDANERKRRHEAMEAICRRCGRCCRQKVRFGDVVVITDVPCEFLDPKTNACTVYPQRLFKQPLCSAIDVAISNGAQPDDCPYVGGNADYRAPLLLEEHPEYREAVDSLFPKTPRIALSPGGGTAAQRAANIKHKQRREK